MYANDRLIEQMSFPEIWEYLKIHSRSKFLSVCKKQMMNTLELKEPTLRHRKRRILFSRLERKAIITILTDFTKNQNLTEDILFPNNPERFVNDYYDKKAKETA